MTDPGSTEPVPEAVDLAAHGLEHMAKHARTATFAPNWKQVLAVDAMVGLAMVALGAVIALAHDVIFTLGFFSLAGLEFDLTVLAALLAVVGYSLNDTIVVSDRIRENLRKIRRASPGEVIDISLTETLGRTLVTSLTTLLVLAALALFGGEMIFGFAVALLVGVAVGTYSSIYVAATTLLKLGVSKEDVMVPEREGADHEGLMP